MKKLLTILVATLFAAPLVSQGQIIVSSGTNLSRSGATQGVDPYTISGFNMSGGNFIAVMITGEKLGTGTDHTAATVTYAGESLNSSLFVNQGGQFASISFLLSPVAASGDVVIGLNGTASGANTAITILSLSNVASINSSDTWVSTDTASETWDYTGTANGFMMLAGIGNQTAVPTLSGDNTSGFTYTRQMTDTWPNASGVGGTTQGYNAISVDGTYSTTMSFGASSSRNAGALLSLNAVPEPASVAFVSLGLAGMLWRSRRRVS